MFDLLGVMSFTAPVAPGELPTGVLQSAKWARGADQKTRVVSGRQFEAIYLERNSDLSFYASEDGMHLFVVGEARLRSDASQFSRCPLLSASSLLALWRAEPQTFIRRIKGNFTLVLADEPMRQVTLYHSRFGISPFYYALDGGRFIFSTSLAAASSCLSSPPELDPAAVAELVLFNYPLGDRTYFRQVKMLRPAEVVSAGASGLRRETWWDVRTLYDAPILPERQAMEQGSELFHKTVNDLAGDTPKLCLSFTSGFDSRAILAVLERERNDLLAYSFGIPGSLNVTIPDQICVRLSLPYRPISLDGEYERVFDEYALRAVLLSDCLSTVERANYPYAFEKLADFSPVVMTGLFGSELMRTFQNVGNIVSANLVRLNLAADPMAELEKLILSGSQRSEESFNSKQKDPISSANTPHGMTMTGGGRYFPPNLLRRAAEQVESDVSAALMERFGDMPPDRRFYMFLLTEGLRKYFGAEIHMERPWAVNRFPYLDDEFVEFAFQAPFAGVYSHTIKPTIGNRFHSQYFYAYVINKYRPSLLAAQTDHGHSPKDLLSPFALLRIGPKYLFWRWWRERIKYREFKTEEWTEALYREHLFTWPLRGDLFSQRLVEDFNDGMWKMRRSDFAKAASLKLWLETME